MFGNATAALAHTAYHALNHQDVVADAKYACHGHGSTETTTVHWRCPEASHADEPEPHAHDAGNHHDVRRRLVHSRKRATSFPVTSPMKTTLATAAFLIAVHCKPGLPTGPLAMRDFRLQFDPAGTFSLSGEGWPAMAGTWTLAGSEITLQNQIGPVEDA